jgi:hypothetical protein
VKKGSYVTIRFQTTPALAGADIGIWVAKWSGGAWSAFKPHTGRTANGSGVVYYYYKTSSAVKLSFRGFVVPNGIHGSAWSSGTEVLWTK